MLRDSSAIHDEIVAAPEHYLCQFPAEGLECGTENEILPLDYKGTINYSRTGKKCVNWAKMSTVGTGQNSSDESFTSHYKRTLTLSGSLC